MQHWSQLGTRNWRAKPGRTAGALGAIALGVGVVIWVTCAYESVRGALRDQVWFWIGHSHLSVESVYGAEGTVFQKISDEAKRLNNVAYVTYRLKRTMIMEKVVAPATQSAPAEQPSDNTAPPPLLAGKSTARDESGFVFGEEVQAIGIEPDLETPFRDYSEDRIAGRMLNSNDTDAAVIEEKLAETFDLKLGDRFTLRAAQLNIGDKPTEAIATFTVVGLLQHNRIAKQQRPIVLAKLDRIQALSGYGRMPKRVTKIDLILKDSEKKSLLHTERKLVRLVNRHKQGFVVTNAQARVHQVEMAERQTRFILLIMSTVALFTAFMVILSTLSMGMVERIQQLGTLRCIGVTRMQLSTLVLGEAVVLGTVGMILGIPVGLGLGKLTVWFAPEYIGHFAISRMGIVLALAGGAITTLAGALLPMVQALRVSALAASRPQTRPTPGVIAWIAALIGVGMIFGHIWMVQNLSALDWIHPNRPRGPIISVILLYGGYALIIPALIRVVGFTAIWAISKALRIRHRLLSDQIGRAVWRSSAICGGLMVGLSLIVTLVVHGESLAAGWNFPKQFCEAFVYITPPAKKKFAEHARQLPGVAESCLVNTSIRCTVYGKGPIHLPWSTFVAGDPEEFFKIAKLEFIKGTRTEAITKLKQGGHILVTPQFVRSKKLDFGDKVYIRKPGLFAGGKTFTIAGVVTSPALDIAANYFNAADMLMNQSILVVLGTLKDAKRAFGVPDDISLLLINFDLPDTKPPAEFEQENPLYWRDPASTAQQIEAWRSSLPHRVAEIDEIAQELETAQAQNTPRMMFSQVPTLRLFREALLFDVVPEWSARTPEQRWRMFREALVMRLVAQQTGSTNEQHASVRALKLQIDRDLRRATQLFAAIPTVALIVAALGVGNLMMANVASRSRELATLRAIGATRWQITRLVIGEALVLGMIGSAVGIALGLHATCSINHIVEQVWGYRPVWTIPWGLTLAGIGFTMAVCLVAGILPARRAARSNIIEALQTT